MIKPGFDFWVLKIDRTNDCVRTPRDSGELYSIEKLDGYTYGFVLTPAGLNTIYFCSKRDTEVFVVKTLDSRNAK